MPFRKISSFVGLIAYIVCLAVGYVAVGQWPTLAVVSIAFLTWLPARKWPSTWLPSVALVVSVSLAVAGLFAGVSPTLMILSTILALASWDLVLLDHSLMGASFTGTVALLEKRHYQSLALALGLGLLLSVTGRLLRFQIPFCGMILLVTLVLFSLERFLRMLVNPRHRAE